MSVRARIVLGTLCTFNAAVLVALGVIAFRFVDGRAGKVGALLFGASATVLVVLARRLRSEDW